MKTICVKRTVLMWCLIASFASCSVVEEEPFIPVAGGPDCISAVIEPAAASDGTKASLKDDERVVWSSTDKITVFGSSAVNFTLAEGAGSTSGKFAGNLSGAGTGPYYAVFPYNNYAKRTSDGIYLWLSQRKYANTDDIAFGGVPMAGKYVDGNIQFRNLFGLLKVTFTSPVSVKIKQITLHDLGGNMLWGGCNIPVKADTLAYNELKLTGGDNTIRMKWNTYTTLNETAKSFYFAVPPGSLDRGFSMVLYEMDPSVADSVGRAYSFLSKVSDPVSSKRSVIEVLDAAEVPDRAEPLDVKARGYYKTLFVDAGPKLSGYYSLSRFKWLTTLGIADDYEYFAADSTGINVSKQASVINKNAQDANGVLLYPDGEPRFRMMYVNGGKSTNHARTLYQDGRSRVHDFVKAGGSYLGTCAGGYLARSIYSNHNCYDNPDTTLNISFGIWPGTLTATYIPIDTYLYPSSYVCQKTVTAFGPFAVGDTIEQIRHHGGFYVASNETNNAIPHETFMTFQYTTKNTADSTSYTDYNRTHYAMYGLGSASGVRASRVNQASMIAYKESEKTGRVFLSGPHPEQSTGGKSLLLMETMVKYTLEGNGAPDVKGELKLGETRNMTKTTADKDPAFTKIGDRQYHHFIFRNDVARDIKVRLSSGARLDLYLALRKDDFAWMSDAEYVVCTSGGIKTLNIKSLPAGTWYVSVYCPVTVTATQKTGSYNLDYFEYSGKTQVLDGVAYSVTVETID